MHGVRRIVVRSAFCLRYCGSVTKETKALSR